MSKWDYDTNNGLRVLLIEDCPEGDRAEQLGFEIVCLHGHEVMTEEDYAAHDWDDGAWLSLWDPSLPAGAIPLWKGLSHDEAEMPYAYYARPVTAFGKALASLAQEHFGEPDEEIVDGWIGCPHCGQSDKLEQFAEERMLDGVGTGVFDDRWHCHACGRDFDEPREVVIYG